MKNAKCSGEITMLGFKKFSVVTVLYFDFLHIGGGKSANSGLAPGKAPLDFAPDIGERAVLMSKGLATLRSRR